MQDMITKQQAISAINATKITRGCNMIAADVINEIEDSNVVVVDDCNDCPLLHWQNGYVCQHPKQLSTTENPFRTCPLKTNSLTIQLETK
jgi:uncharacterized protein YfaT (DUF1175 family)